MFIRQYFKQEAGRRTAYWALVESHRTATGPRQRVVAWLGKLDEAGRLGVQQAVDVARKSIEPGSETEHMQPLGRQLRFEFDDDQSAVQPRWVEVNAGGVRVEHLRQFGGPWLALHLIQTLQLDTFLDKVIPEGREYVPWDVSSLILIIARLLEPSSELFIAEQWYPKTSLPDLLGVPEERIDDNRLYRALDQLDRGMVSEDNIEFLREGGRRYIVGTPKSMLKKIEQEILKEDWHSIRDGLEVKIVPWPKSDDDDASTSDIDSSPERFILCRSRERSKKEEGITQRFEKKIEESLSRMKARSEKQARDPMKVEREIGRMLGKNSRAAKLFDVKVTKRDKNAARIEWTKVEATRDWTTLSAGCYLLRTNVADWSDEELWKAYIQLTEAEAAFRIHKSDLSIRPIWHQKEERVLAHIFVCFLAYVLWKTFGQLCDKAGLGSEPRRVLAELSDIRSMDVVLPTRSGPEIRTRCISKPTDHQQILLEKLRLKLPSKIIQKKM
jgi:hypothetical protein